MRYFSDQPVPRTEEDRERWGRRRRSVRPLDLLRNIWLRVAMPGRLEAARSSHEAPDLTDIKRADMLEMLARQKNNSAGQTDYEIRVELTKNVARLLEWMTGLGYTPPPLPRQVVETMREEDMLESASPDELMIAHDDT